MHLPLCSQLRATFEITPPMPCTLAPRMRLRSWCSAGPDGIAAWHCRCAFKRALTTDCRVEGAPRLEHLIKQAWKHIRGRCGDCAQRNRFEAQTQISNISDFMKTFLGLTVQVAGRWMRPRFLAWGLPPGNGSGRGNLPQWDGETATHVTAT